LEPGQRRRYVSILWIILIVIVVLALLGFFSRGVW
jgi:flagellar basal body-associated protein FliL